MSGKWVALALCLACVLGLSACVGRPDEGRAEPPEESRIKVSVTFNAMKEFAQAVGGDRVEVSVIVPDGAEPHDFEPKAQDMAGLSAARIFIYNGIGMEPWAEDAVAAAGNKGLIAVEASSGAELIENTDEEAVREHGRYDPHLWLSLKGAETELGNIRDAFIRVEPSNRDYYEANYSAYVSKLEKLYDEYSGKFQSVRGKSFITGHAAFAYLCRDFGLEQRSVEDVFAEGEPSARQLAELVDFCRENRVATIFAEKMASPEVSETLAGEVGAKVEAIYTIESAEDGRTYLERMEDNLKKIFESLSR